MKTKNPITLIAGWIALAMAPAQAAHAADVNPAARVAAGREAITGVVTNSATGRAVIPRNPGHL